MPLSDRSTEMCFRPPAFRAPEYRYATRWNGANRDIPAEKLALRELRRALPGAYYAPEPRPPKNGYAPRALPGEEADSSRGRETFDARYPSRGSMSQPDPKAEAGAHSYRQWNIPPCLHRAPPHESTNSSRAVREHTRRPGIQLVRQPRRYAQNHYRRRQRKGRRRPNYCRAALCLTAEATARG